MKLHARVMERVTAYRLWQAPFAEKKLAPLFQHNKLAAARRVLDVGCGCGDPLKGFVQDADDSLLFGQRRDGKLDSENLL